MRKVLFLDIDGVLNSSVWINGLMPDFDGVMISPDLVSNLNKVIAATGCDIVISSDWRRGIHFMDLQDILHKTGINGNIIGTTPISGGITNNLEDDRVDEINTWLKRDPADSWVAVDDMDLTIGGIDPDNFVRTNFVLGLTSDDAGKIIRKLG
jgi:hypothetical protein